MELRFLRKPTEEEIKDVEKWSATSKKILEMIAVKGSISTAQLQQLTGYKPGTIRAQISLLRRMDFVETAVSDLSNTRRIKEAARTSQIASGDVQEGEYQTGISLTEIPSMAKDETVARELFDKQGLLPTSHELYLGDSREMQEIAGDSVHLIVTSPPYWILKKYEPVAGQLGTIQDYHEFLDELGKVLRECYRALIPGGRFVCVVGDVCLPRKKVGKHLVYPLHSDITIRCRNVGFDNLTPVLWYKIASARYEANTYSTILGKPYEPNAVIKNDIEFILIQRKPGPYRAPTMEQRKLSLIPRKYYEQWFRQIWNIRGESTRVHPAPFPLELALRLVRMYSFVGDTILDPFVGAGTTMLAAMQCGRNSVGYEIDPKFAKIAKRRLLDESTKLLKNCQVHFYVAGHQTLNTTA